MDKPANYNTSSIKVDPDTLWTQGFTTLPDQSKAVVGTLTSISDTWNALKLSWFGDSAETAKGWNDNYIKILDRMFGAPGVEFKNLPAGEGILPKIANAAASAASNFGNAEDAVVKTFQPFIDAKPGPPGSGRDYTTGPITETNTPKTPGN